jgi:hypothetical protein
MKISVNQIFIILFCGILIATSCQKEEQPIKLPPRGNTTFMSINLGKDFEQQAFLNLKDSQITFVNNSIWDLAFEVHSNLITLNGGNDMYAASIKSNNFIYSNKPDTFNFKWDAPCGCPDSLAINYHYFDYIYIIDRGSHITDKRYLQMRVIKNTPYEVQFIYTDLLTPEKGTLVSLKKDYNKVNVYFSFNTPNTKLNFEPNMEDWDLCFLKYRYVFHETNPVTKYIVKGIFINHQRIDVAVDSVQQYENIVPSYATDSCHYSNMRDVIGYDWKIYNFVNGQYQARTHVNYMVRNYFTGEIYKLRFLDFNHNGIKGTPKFEYILLK